jgi:prepilin-type N-terminal cleavage/methylation domain-containing protein
MRTTGRKRGYSLIELMVVITIIGVSIVAFAPGFKLTMIQREASSAVRDMVRLSRRAMSEAASGAAHTVWIEPTGPNGGPRLQLLRGSTGSCTAQAWANISAACPTDSCGDAHQGVGGCLESIDYGCNGYFTSGSGLELTEELGGLTPQANRAICYTPRGAVFTAQVSDDSDMPPSGAFTRSLPGGGAVYALTVKRADGTLMPPVRRILFPTGSSAKAVR